ncbi:hypothetical protein MtrunA17_Chr7g0269911 [Medicago truncatula]|uniref:Uncharacterized protein n=1 Tax=Medicago truncatula TaxID=3880 RepID=G7KSS8_MEDTR|nr:hypothetical protein MTR_7g109440 [Medicago truncatula]RHN49012.1 hypothetical protein MtrunA17_Chr7g0269911 [Medicago truncatula]
MSLLRRMSFLKRDGSRPCVRVSRVNCKASEFEIEIAEKRNGNRKESKTAKVSPVTKLTENDNGGVYSLFVKGDGILYWIQFLNPVDYIISIRATNFATSNEHIHYIHTLFEREIENVTKQKK